MNRFRTATVAGLLIAVFASAFWRFGIHDVPAAPGTVTHELNGLPVEILIRGHDFVWQFQYAGPDSVWFTDDDIVWGSELVLPPETPVEFHVESDDYIYTFSMDGRQAIVVPGLRSSLQFNSPATGWYFLKADPLCGFRPWHDDVMGTIWIDPALQPGEFRSGELHVRRE